MDLFLDLQFYSNGLSIVCLYHTVLIIIAIEFSLKSGSVTPPALFLKATFPYTFTISVFVSTLKGEEGIF